jgi:hypothetical protein
MPLHRIKQGLMPPHQIRDRWFDASFPGNLVENPNSSMRAHTKGVKKTFRSGLRYEAWGYRVPSMGHQVSQLLATLCVASFLVLVALGGSDPIDGFFVQTLRFGRPHVNRGTRFRYGCRIPWRIGRIVRGVEWCIKMFLPRLWSPAALPRWLLHHETIK